MHAVDNKSTNRKREAGSMAKLLFNAADASQTEFSQKWVAARVRLSGRSCFTYHLLLTTYYLLYMLHAACYLLRTTYYVLPTTYYLLPTTYYLLPAMYYSYLIPTTYYTYYLSYFAARFRELAHGYFTLRVILVLRRAPHSASITSPRHHRCRSSVGCGCGSESTRGSQNMSPFTRTQSVTSTVARLENNKLCCLLCHVHCLPYPHSQRSLREP